jgi:4-alpha-glucanotransferase
MTRRQSGISVPLFTLASTESWGLGEFHDLPMFAKWAGEAGQSVLQILPINELPPIERSPYSAISAMALDPIYISLPQVVDFAGLGGELALDAADRAVLASVRGSARIRYSEIRTLKQRWLRHSYDRFVRLDVSRGSPRAARFATFVADEAWWLDEYAVFRALHAWHEELPWHLWPELLARAEATAVSAARQALRSEIDYRMYLQWIAAEQWAEAKRLAWPLRILGDLPFMNSVDSPDVWARQREFRFDATIGAPPDAFSETGQDWGLPPWRWDVMAESGFAWMRARARRYAALYDGFRIDHLVGLYRMYIRPLDQAQPAFFAPGDEPTQTRLGETMIGVLGSGSPTPMLIAEDLGVIPPFVRASMARLDLPGLKVLRWEKHWDRPGHPAIDPKEFPDCSVATTGTHDIEPLAATEDGQTDEQRAATLRSLLSAGSRLTLIPLQDVFGWTDRINTPAVVDEINWTWRLPLPVDQWLDGPRTVEPADRLRAWTRDADR